MKFLSQKLERQTTLTNEIRNRCDHSNPVLQPVVKYKKKKLIQSNKLLDDALIL